MLWVPLILLACFLACCSYRDGCWLVLACLGLSSHTKKEEESKKLSLEHRGNTTPLPKISNFYCLMQLPCVVHENTNPPSQWSYSLVLGPIKHAHKFHSALGGHRISMNIPPTIEYGYYAYTLRVGGILGL